MTVTLSMNNLSQGLLQRANLACIRAEAMRAQSVEAAARLSAVHESRRRIFGPAAPVPLPQVPVHGMSHKLRLVLAVQAEQAALRHVDRHVRTQWLLQKCTAAGSTVAAAS